jgi:hypothetical protein
VTDIYLNRIMVIGSHVATVQRVSRYCLEQGAEVLPYYGIPTDEEVTLFAPDVSILCLPIPENFHRQIGQRYILWSEQSIDISKRESETLLLLKLKSSFWTGLIEEGLPWVATPPELHAHLQAAYQLKSTLHEQL